MSFEVRLRPAAIRAIEKQLPEMVAAAVIEFVVGPLRDAPLRVGKPLSGPLEGSFGARRGTYRIIYRVDVEQRVVDVMQISHRSTAYRRR